ncbi:MAG: DUF5666 domain-containing protein [Nitrospiria bacterium]
MMKEMNRLQEFTKVLLPLMLLAGLNISCGDSGSGTASGSIGGTGISQGTITGFGSVIVNGVEFNTDNASFTVNDQGGKTQDDLRVGQVVKIRVGEDGRTATQVEYEAEVEGPVDSRDDATTTLVALGRTVLVDDTTKIEDSANNPLNFTDLNTNDMLEISGIPFADDSLQATHIKKTGTFVSGDELELKGTVKGLSGSTFMLGGQTVDFGGIAPLSFTIADGQVVEVKGTRSDATKPLIATSIELEDALGANEADKIELEGVVTKFTDLSDFEVNGQKVSTDSGTTYEDGEKDDVAQHVRLEVEGTITGGVLVAKKVQFRGNRVKIEASVDAGGVNSTTKTLTLLGGVVVQINDVTEMEDKLSPPVPNFSITDISDGNYMKIRGYVSGSKVIATRVHRESVHSDVRLQAPVDSFSSVNFRLVLLGVTVDAASAAFEDRNDAPLGRDTFFSQVKNGDLVKAKGNFTPGSGIGATEVEFEG